MLSTRAPRETALDGWLQRADRLLDADNDISQHDVLPGLWATIPKERGLNLELRRGSIFDTSFVMLVDYSTSDADHGDRVLFRTAQLPRVLEELASLARYVGTGGSARASQGRLF